SLKTSIKTITYLSDIGCLEIQGASLGSMKSVSLQRIQPLTEQLNLGLTAGKVWYDTPTDDYNGLQLAAHLTWKF
ncbi:hypothetical protein RNP60_12610, partial [Escherichia coli]|nr:hypothetical protein [Escherichia coli]